ncbi:alpha/beta hydrolase domain-containing protein [Nocardioides sp. SR21]|uniref:alpha/beta hydrolase domain-containing protein n=1 Tax=Nocardioides sp. SR21 TaxID=2919501 RepID=UPI001FA9F547|nr:alpha/beta hydrolase domain-containing protein [Nocardioides sp. SR21]
MADLLRAAFTALTSGNGVSLTSANSGPDLIAHGYEESELRAAGTAPAPYATRVLVRRPAAGFSGTLVVEWLNVSSGSDAAPDWTYLAEEIVRRGHAWAGVSAQRVGVEGGAARVETGIGLGGLKVQDPQRYGDLAHPGDEHAYEIYTQVARGLAADLGATCVLAVGESQSAAALTTYLDVLGSSLFDGFLVHSRPGGALHTDAPTRIPDVGVPVITVQTEGDLLGRLNYLPARQPDAERFRLWEIAGSAHVDLFQIGGLESFLGCPDPVNRGQQAYVVRAALRWLEGWARGGSPAPAGDRLEIVGDDLVLDEHGNVRGGVRTPVVDAPADVLSGYAAADASPICGLFGRTLPLAAPAYASHEEYLAAYTAATDAAIEAGFVLLEDRDAVLAEAR